MRNAIKLFVGISVLLVFWYLAIEPLSESAVQPLEISGIVLPHHDLVKAHRQGFLAAIARDIKPPRTVLVVSPNHYEAGNADIQTTDKVWELSNGRLEPNREALVGNIETSSFNSEHGIYNVLADIKRVWPDAKIVPIILKFDARIDNLALELDQKCRECLMVASVDFSHYQPAVLAKEHDELTIRALNNLDEELVRTKAEVDSPASLQLLMQWAESHQTQRFNLWKHTIFETTHVFGYYGEGERQKNEKRVSFLIGGDMMFARGIHYRFQKDLKESVARIDDRLFWGTDLALINLEGKVSKTPVVPDPRQTFDFVFPPETVDVLKWMHVNAVSINNNHAFGVRPEGIPTLPYTVPGEGLKLTVIGVHTLWSVPDIKNQISKIKTDPDQRVIIFPHWGTEYEPVHNAQQERLAHEWIDAGADLVVGAHPHIVQDIEVYQGKLIVYSLGNLLFDQDWSLPTQRGLLLGGAFTEDGLEYFTIPVVSKNFQPEVDLSGVSDVSIIK